MTIVIQMYKERRSPKEISKRCGVRGRISGVKAIKKDARENGRQPERECHPSQPPLPRQDVDVLQDADPEQQAWRTNTRGQNIIYKVKVNVIKIPCIVHDNY